MASSSLKKTGGAPIEREGNYASSDNLVNGRVSHRGLGLTLLPGSQIPKDGTETPEITRDGKPGLCVRRSRQQGQKVDSSTQVEEGPTAQAAPLQAKNGLKPLPARSVNRNSYATRPSERRGRNVERDNLLFTDSFVAKQRIVGGSNVSYSQASSSSSKYAIGSGNASSSSTYGETEGGDVSRDLHLGYGGKRRRVGSDGASGRRLKCTIRKLEGADQSTHSEACQREVSGRNALRRKSPLYPVHTSSLADYPGRGKRSQRTTRSGKVSSENVSGSELARGTGSEGSCRSSNVIKPPVTSLTPDLLEDPNQIYPLLRNDHLSCSGIASKGALVPRLSAKHRRRVKLNSAQPRQYHSESESLRDLGTEYDTSSPISLGVPIVKNGRLTAAKLDAQRVLVSPLASTLPNLGNPASAKPLRTFCVNQPLDFFQHSQHLIHVNSHIDNHSSSISAFPSTSFALHNSTSNSDLFSQLKLRTRSNSLPNLKFVSSKATMKNPNGFQQYGLATPEKSPPKQRIQTPDSLSYYQPHGSSAASDRNRHPRQLPNDFDRMEDIYQPSCNAFGRTLPMHMPQPWSGPLSRTDVTNQIQHGYALGQPGPPATFVHPTRNSVEAFPQPGMPPRVIPLHELHPQAQKENEILKASLANSLEQIQMLQVACRQQHTTYTGNLQALKETAAHQSHEIERLRHDVFQWKTQAEQFYRLLHNPPPNSLSGETLYTRIVQGNDTIDLTAEDNSSEMPSSSPSASVMSREPSSQGQGSQARDRFTKNLAQKPLAWIDVHPLKEPENPYLAKRQVDAQTVIDVDAGPEPFVFNPSAEEVQAALARKNNASYASYQQTTRVTKNSKKPKVTKAQQRQLEKGQTPAPEAGKKKQRKERVKGPRESRQQKLARRESEKLTEVEDEILQLEQFRKDALEREAQEKRDEKAAEDIEKLLEDELEDELMSGADEEDKEPTAGENVEQEAAEAADKSSHGSSEAHKAMSKVNNAAEQPNAAETHEQAATAPEDDAANAMFEDDAMDALFEDDSMDALFGEDAMDALFDDDGTMLNVNDA